MVLLHIWCLVLSTHLWINNTSAQCISGRKVFYRLLRSSEREGSSPYGTPEEKVEQGKSHSAFHSLSKYSLSKWVSSTVDDLGQILLQEFARWETLSEEPREAWYLGGTVDLRDFGWTSAENSNFSMFAGTSMDSKLPSFCSFVDTVSTTVYITQVMMDGCMAVVTTKFQPFILLNTITWWGISLEFLGCIFFLLDFLAIWCLNLETWHEIFLLFLLCIR